MMKTALKRVKKAIGLLITKIQSQLVAGLRFVKQKPFLLFVIVSNVVVLTLMIALSNRGQHVPWGIACVLLLSSFSVCFAYYCNEFFLWCHEKSHHVIERVVSFVNECFITLCPIGFFLLGMKYSSLYFEEHLSKIDMIGCVLVVVVQLFLVVYYCRELSDIHSPKYTRNIKVRLFLFCLIHIVQLFANVYIICFIMDPSFFAGVSVDSAFSICFDLTYFSAMTMFSGGCEIAAVSIITRTLSFVEIFIFVVVISMVILGILPSAQEEHAENKLAQCTTNKDSSDQKRN